MSCPDWNVLAARRERDGADPTGWPEALEHFDTCSLCRRDALTADPLLVFRRLPVAEPTPAEEGAEIQAMRQAVTAMRTARRIESGRRFAGWRRWAAAAVLATASLGVGRDRAPSLEQAATLAPAPRPAVESSAPELEGLNRPGARVYHLGSDVLMIVDEGLGV